ncbi:hypothetical protein WMF01_47780 [Sorangium sp. So ce1667]
MASLRHPDTTIDPNNRTNLPEAVHSLSAASWGSVWDVHEHAAPRRPWGT